MFLVNSAVIRPLYHTFWYLVGGASLAGQCSSCTAGADIKNSSSTGVIPHSRPGHWNRNSGGQLQGIYHAVALQQTVQKKYRTTAQRSCVQHLQRSIKWSCKERIPASSCTRKWRQVPSCSCRHLTHSSCNHNSSSSYSCRDLAAAAASIRQGQGSVRKYAWICCLQRQYSSSLKSTTALQLAQRFRLWVSEWGGS